MPIDVLEQYGFDISHNTGDILVSYHNIDSVPVMKTVFSALFPANLKLRDSLSMRELFVLNQRRHLIVHRRGIVDAEYAKLTKDETPVGTELRITPSELEHYLELVRDTGIEIMLAANSVILPEPKP